MDPGGHGQSGRDDNWLRRGAPFAVPVLVAAGIFILYELLPVLEIVAFAALIALILRTFVRWMGTIGVNSWFASLILFGLLGALVAFVTFVVLPNLVTETAVLLSALPGYLSVLADASRNLHRSANLIPDLYGDLGQLQGYLSGTLGSLPRLLGTATGFLIDAIATLVLALYMAHDPGSLIRGLLRFVPRHREEAARELIEKLEVRLRGWIVGLLLAMLIVGGGAGVGLWMLGVPLALTFGIMAGLLEIIPYFGQVIGALLPALVALTISPLKALLVIVLFIILNQADDYLVQPLVMGREVNLHPVVVIISFLAFGTLLGFTGLLLAVPAAAFLVTLADELTKHRFDSRKGTPDKATLEDPAAKPLAERGET